MNGFFRTLAYGLAAICIVMLVAGLTALSSLRASGKLNAKALRTGIAGAYRRDGRRRARQSTDDPLASPAGGVR